MLKTISISGQSISASSGSLSNYDVQLQTTAVGTISKVPLSVNLNNVTTTYGTVAPLTYSMSGFVNGETASTAAVSLIGLQSSGYTGLSTTNNVANYSITASGVSAQNYTLNSANISTGTLTIIPATLTFTPDAKSRFVTQTDPVLTFSVSGLVNGDSSSAYSAPTINRTPGSVAGSYEISMSGGSATNYSLTKQTNNFLILAADKVAIALRGVTTIYGTVGTPIVDSVQYLDGDDNVIVSLTHTTGSMWSDGVGGTISITPTLVNVSANSHVGTYFNAVSAAHSHTQSANGNFNDVAVIEANYIVNKKSLTVQANDVSRVYDGSVFSSDQASISASGLVLGQNVASLGDITYTGSAINSRYVGEYDITPTVSNPDGLAANYDITYASGKLEITPKHITISGLTINPKVYDGTTSAIANLSSVVLEGKVAGDDVILNSPVAIFDHPDAGISKLVTLASQTISGNQAANYTLIDAGVGPTLTYSGSITPKLLDVIGFKALDKVYDGNVNATLNSSLASLQGVLSADLNDVVLDNSAVVGAFQNKNTHAANVVSIEGFRLSGTKASNYSFSSDYQTFDTAAITPKPLIVQANAASGLKYDSTVHHQTATVSGMITGDQVFVSGLVSESNAGDYASNLNLSGPDLINYTPSLLDLAFSISKADATVIINSAAKTYNAAIQSVSGYSTQGLYRDDILIVNGDTISGRDVGMYTSAATAIHRNYFVTVQQGRLTIYPAPNLSNNDPSKLDTLIDNATLNPTQRMLTSLQLSDKSQTS
jgi:hypothetical protein